MSLLALLATASPQEYPPLPDQIPGGERPAPYSLDFGAGPYWAPTTMVHPTPDGTGQSVHPSVVDMVAQTGRPFRGFRYWMAHTPYAGENVAKENPNIAVSNNGWEWQEPQGIANPIFGPPSTGFFGDTDLVWDHENKRFFLSWLQLAGDNQWTATSADGVNWTATGKIGGFGSSPSVVRRGPGDWWMMKGDEYGTGSVPVPTVYTATNPAGPWTTLGTATFTKPPGAEGIWHYGMAWDSVTSRWHWLGVDRSWRAFPAVSDDGLTWRHGPHLPGKSNFYRPCLTLDGDHYNVWGSRHNAPPDVSQWWLQYVRIPRSRWDSIA